MARFVNHVTNEGEEEQVLTYLSSFTCSGIKRDGNPGIMRLGDQNCHFYLAVSRSTEIQSHWSKNLKPGDSFTKFLVAVGVGHDDFEEAIGTLTKYRRKIRRPNKDNENCRLFSMII